MRDSVVTAGSEVWWSEDAVQPREGAPGQAGRQEGAAGGGCQEAGGYGHPILERRRTVLLLLLLLLCHAQGTPPGF